MGAERRHARKVVVNRSEGFGERLLGTLLDRAHQMPPQLIAPLVAEEAAGIGGEGVVDLLPDIAHKKLAPLTGGRPTAGEREPPSRAPYPPRPPRPPLPRGCTGGPAAAG